MNVKIEFNEQQLAALNQAIGELPCKIGVPLLNHINAEIQKCFDEAKDEQTSSGAITEAQA